MTLDKLAIFDIDGVLADDRHRVQYAIERKWYQYFDEKRMSEDKVWEQGRRMVENAQILGYQIAYMTGRRQDRRLVTENWLDRHGFPMGRLTMRTYSETQRLADFKADKIADVLLYHNYDEVILFDDDPEVIKTIQDEFGEEFAVHCTWHVKEKSLVRKAGTTYSTTGTGFSTTAGKTEDKSKATTSVAKPGTPGYVSPYRQPDKSGVSEPLI